jgi:hypothetical protein
MKKFRSPLYARHRFPAEVISLAVWLYFRFPLRLRMVEEMLAAHGVEVSHETVRFGPRSLATSSPPASTGGFFNRVVGGISMKW